MKILHLTLPLIFVLAGCSQGGANQRLCEKSVKESLINPETAEFMEFKTVPLTEASDLLKNYMVKAVMEKDPRIAEYGLGSSVESDASNSVKTILEGVSSTYVMRMKAEGKLGNKITSNQLCMISENDCSCQDLD